MIQQKEQTFCQIFNAGNFRALNTLVHGSGNKINLLTETKTVVGQLIIRKTPSQPNYKPLVRSSLHLNMPVTNAPLQNGAIEYLRELYYNFPLRPYPYGAGRTAAKAIGIFMGNLVSDQRYQAGFERTYVSQLMLGVQL
jgi:hypothetical protein